MVVARSTRGEGVSGMLIRCSHVVPSEISLRRLFLFYFLRIELHAQRLREEDRRFTVLHN